MSVPCIEWHRGRSDAKLLISDCWLLPLQADLSSSGMDTGQLAQEHAAWCGFNGGHGYWPAGESCVLCSLAVVPWGAECRQFADALPNCHADAAVLNISCKWCGQCSRGAYGPQGPPKNVKKVCLRKFSKLISQQYNNSKIIHKQTITTNQLYLIHSIKS